MIDSKNNYRGLYVIAFITLASYLNSLFNGFVWDDRIFMLKDSAISNFEIAKILFSNANGIEFIPMHTLTLAIDYLLWGSNPLGFHLSNFIIYLASVITFYLIIINIPIHDLDKSKVAFWTSIVFAVHPMHSEPVNFISNRCHLLALFFVLLSSYWLVRWLIKPHGYNLLLALLFFLLSLFSKQSVVAFPILVLATLLLHKNSHISMRQRVIAAAGFIITDIIAVIFHIQNAVNSSTAVSEDIFYNSGSLLTKIIKTINIYSFYIYKYIFPSGLTIYYDSDYLFSGISVSSALSFILMIGVLTLALRSTKKHILITCGIVWYSIMLVPALNFFNTSPVIANRYGLIPSLGLSIVIGYTIYRCNEKYRFSRHIAVAVLLIFTAITINKNIDWKSDYTLFKAAVELNPKAPRANYADALWQQKRYAEALATLKEGMNLTGSHHYYYFLGNLYAEQGKYKEAVEAYKSALAQNGDIYKRPHLALANTYLKIGDDLNAIREYLNVIDSIEFDPQGALNAEAEKNIAIIQGRYLPEINRIKNKLALDDKNAGLLSEMALLNQNIGKYNDAVYYYDKLIATEPANWIAWHNKALCFLKAHKPADSISAFEHSFSLNNKNVDALNHIGSIYIKSKDFVKGEEYFKKAVSADQSHVHSIFNLARLYSSTGRKSEAEKYFARAVSLSGNNAAIKSKALKYMGKM